MLNSETAKALFSDYLEDELDPLQKEALEAYLATDSYAREELDALRRTLGSLSGLKSITPPADFVHRVERKLRRQSLGRRRAEQLITRRVPFEWLAFILILVLVTLYLLTLFEAK